MQIVLVRHGETEWSLSGQHTSRTDLPLIEVGRERARALGPLLAQWSFSSVLTSPLRRARETCELAGFGDRAEVFDDLREWDYGEYEGLTTHQIREDRSDWFLWRDGCPGGEQPSEIGARADRVLERMRGAGGDVLAFAHGHIFRVLAARWIQLPACGGARLALKAGAICVLGYERETEVISLWNDAPR
ncbi:MAG: histidine phosphatase family protein [Solirubrobacterales bacterium]|nr:histidine phosphatase family protein [Solirubrobacterales bacterium]MBV9364911.1 histidine phosphatase family protein [Solirubrobacterales bacterium]MBV9810785.1 histidine phosphatase family protein [Solirubrobacterales bacterium]